MMTVFCIYDGKYLGTRLFSGDGPFQQWVKRMMSAKNKQVPKMTDDIN